MLFRITATSKIRRELQWKYQFGKEKKTKIKNYNFYVKNGHKRNNINIFCKLISQSRVEIFFFKVWSRSGDQEVSKTCIHFSQYHLYIADQFDQNVGFKKKMFFQTMTRKKHDKFFHDFKFPSKIKKTFF